MYIIGIVCSCCRQANKTAVLSAAGALGFLATHGQARAMRSKYQHAAHLLPPRLGSPKTLARVAATGGNFGCMTSTIDQDAAAKPLIDRDPAGVGPGQIKDSTKGLLSCVDRGGFAFMIEQLDR